MNASGAVETVTQNAARPAKKIYVVYTIVDSEPRNVWRRVGNAWVNRDGSFNLSLDALPVNGKLHMREMDLQQQQGGER